MSKSLIISTIDDLYGARYAIDLDRVDIFTARLKTRGLLPHAIKYGLWALRDGGILTIQDDGPYKMEIFDVDFNAVRPLARHLLHGDVRLLEVDDDAFRIVFERNRPVPAPGWSAGIVFSGNDNELPALYKCLNGLYRQPELTGESGEIIICGPTRDQGFLANYPDIRYVVYDIPPDRIFPISEKKNFLMAQMRYPRAVLMHARIILDDGCLANMPREFDAASPAVSVDVNGKRHPYLDFVIGERFDMSRPSRRFNEPLKYPRNRYLEFLDRGYPYIDGGCIFVSSDTFAKIPFYPALQWNDQEDAEWAARLQAHGKLVDLIPRATALTQGNRMGRSLTPTTWDRIRFPFRRIFRYSRTWLRLYILRLLHRR